ncbi:ATP-dependent RNA helicase HrpB [Paenibacillus sp. CECT 9249]|uniref:ATP-dependent helicase HrpB n=1 Tax=Paenibacillus sp. CECT 9249 TaxID=2845385 RepID=UPI001E5A6F0A|nr:ATP-dependent helicase HrpB [Paenibacillus sp. CECT 9249]CAH0118221.1 ATP-dependent RNA helicase HrpB [Paenibacillus sp. CECT 9249]
MASLPIESILPALKESLRARSNAVVIASPGAGKTTRIPLALLDEPWLQGRRIVMLEPRRLAARSAARYMARSLGEDVGETVGYRVRMDSRVGKSTRIEVITEGVLTRLLQADQALEEVGIVIFDEFHERSLHADLGLALCLQSQAVLRDDLRILVMSATLEAEPVSALLGDAPVLVSEGRSFPVETRYLPRRGEERMEDRVARTVLDALAEQEGDILAFLPGAGEIRRVESWLAERIRDPRIRISPLHGSLPQEGQDAAIAPCPPGERKVVLATSIAETSLTVEGVRVVIDSGLMRVPRFSPRTAMTRLETVNVSRASADQRRGRAGRLGPGICYRLWTEQEERRLEARSTPELLAADLAPLTLELAAWGVSDPAELSWLDPVPEAAYAQARDLLRQLGALGPEGNVTPHGRRMAELGLHPRLAHMLLRAETLRLGGLACELAALLSERDMFRGAGAAPDADIRLRIEALRSQSAGKADTYSSGAGAGRAYSIDWAASRRILSEANHWKRMLGIAPDAGGSADACGLLLAFAYPDRIAKRRENGRYLLSNGRGAAFAELQPLASAPYLVAAELDDQGAESRIYLAAPVAESELERHFGVHIMESSIIAWDREAQAVRARTRKLLGALVIREAPQPEPDPEGTSAALMQGIREEGLAILPWTRAARQMQARLRFMHKHEPGWPDASDEALAASLEEWLAPYAGGMRSRGDLQRLNLVSALEAALSWDKRRELDDCAPTHITVPSGSRIPIDYSDPDGPVLAVRLQEMFGLTETPRLARGKVPLILHLLSPAQRPVQVTRDLAGFWSKTYFDVRKDLKGRYPKHYWPDDPLSAPPTNRVRPR